jgi:hypothetical protein
MAMAALRKTDGQAMNEVAAALDWPRIESELDEHGVGLTGPLLDAGACAALSALYAEPQRFRSRIVMAQRYPDALDDFLALCHAQGQERPTPLLLKYGAGDYNCLHQDLYGDLFFPFQMVILLSEPGKDFTGGEFTLVEQRPRMQSRPEVVPLRQGEAAIFAVQHRPVQGTRGTYRVNLRHGVSRVRSGERYTTGLIFHDAR